MADQVYTIAELDLEIADIKAKIRASRGSQSYGVGGKTLTRGSLKDLKEELTKFLRMKRIMLYGVVRYPILDTRS